MCFIASIADRALLREEPNPSYSGTVAFVVFLSNLRSTPVKVFIFSWSSLGVMSSFSSISAAVPAIFSMLCCPSRVVVIGMTASSPRQRSKVVSSSYFMFFYIPICLCIWFCTVGIYFFFYFWHCFLYLFVVCAHKEHAVVWE